MDTIKILAIVLVTVLSIKVAAQEHKHSDHSKMEMKTDTVKTENFVREGKIDLKVLDKNKDGKVFQDPMDWNVISDEDGKCPLCKMTLKEVTLKQAKENLKKHGFKVK